MGILLGNVSFFYLTTNIKDNITKTSSTYLLISASLLVFHEFSYTILGKIITITVEILHPPTETENHCRLPLIHITFFYMCVFLTSRTVRHFIFCAIQSHFSTKNTALELLKGKIETLSILCMLNAFSSRKVKYLCASYMTSFSLSQKFIFNAEQLRKYTLQS